ncbi:RcnB family protein [Sphingomonas sp. 8AM]|uniref:RcnB family protein n=1 Tax=Sphingomonas sp. 8AM TaxID=2653170 RepID=UPI001F2C670F|nr:RcnB family protein [Sphingomonas sp. 8AM]
MAMLKAMIAGLLSMTALVPPALAQDGRSMDRGQWRRERAERPAPAPEPAPRPAPAAEIARPPEPAPRRWAREGAPERRDPAGWGRGDSGADVRNGDWRSERPPVPRDDRRVDGAFRPAAPDGDWRSGRSPEPRGDRRVDGVPRPPAPDGDWRSERPLAPRGDWRGGREPQGRRDDWRDPARQAPDRVWRADPDRRGYERRDAPRPPATVWRADSNRQWDRGWRREPQYDWNRYRNERRSVFRLPRYYAPYGWDSGYRRFGVGIAIAPMLYTPRYWIYDPYAYSLPDAEEPYRWVRYYDDALLVDIEDGTVVDVIHGIFE